MTEFDPFAPTKEGQYTPIFRELISQWRGWEYEYQHLKPMILAQWLLESNRGHTDLARGYLNFAGLKWRDEMLPYAQPTQYVAHDGPDTYCLFRSVRQFIAGWVRFIERSPYAGWRDHANDPAAWIAFLHASGYAEDPQYAVKVARLVPEAERLLDMVGVTKTEPEPPKNCCGIGEDGDDEATAKLASKPRIDRFVATTQRTIREARKIDCIVFHYTTSTNFDGTIHWFSNAPKGQRTSAHFLISQEGELVQMVELKDIAWHASGGNSNSVGIEMEAREGQSITPAQTAKLGQLTRWLIDHLEIDPRKVIPHKAIKATNCCGDIFQAFGGHRDNNAATETEAIRRWLETPEINGGGGVVPQGFFSQGALA